MCPFHKNNNVIKKGLIEFAIQLNSPNQDARPEGTEINLIIIHGISLPPGEFGNTYIQDLFMNKLDFKAHQYFENMKNLKVSAHLLINRDGVLFQFVPFHNRAWHAGESSFRGKKCCNDFSIGIELEGTDHEQYTDEQYSCLGKILQLLFNEYPFLSPRKIAGHCDVSPLRKTDPGPAFNWFHLYTLLGK